MNGMFILTFQLTIFSGVLFSICSDILSDILSGVSLKSGSSPRWQCPLRALALPLEVRRCQRRRTGMVAKEKATLIKSRDPGRWGISRQHEIFP